MLDKPHRYPLLRSKRRRGQAGGSPRPSARAIRIALTLAVLALVLGGIVVLARRAAAPDPRAALAESLAALKRGNYSAARNHALVAVTGADAAAANAVLGRVDLLMGRGVAAEGALTRAVAAGMPADRLHQLFAEAYLLQGDADRALAEAARAAPRYAGPAERVRARALAAKGDVPGAVVLLERLVDRDPRDGGAFGDLGRIRFDSGDVLGADVAARRALALDPANLDAIVLAGEVVRSRYGLRAAMPWFNKALERDAYYHPALIEYAATAGDLGQYGIMLEASRRALAARPNSPQALYLQAVLAARAGKRELARTLIGRTGDAGFNVPGVVLLAGLIAYADGSYEQAVISFGELIDRQPMNLVARRLLGASLLRSGDARAALEALRPMAVRADADSYTLMLAGRAFEATGERDWAARLLDRAARPMLGDPRPFASDAGPAALANIVAKAPDDPAAAVAYVRGLIDAGDGAGALRQAGAVADASPGAPGAQLLAGDAYAATGEFGPALARYRRAADLRFDAPVMLRLVEAAVRTGQRTQGAEALALYLSQSPQSMVARRALANLQLGVRDWEAAADTLEVLRAPGGNRDALLLAQLGYAYTGAGDPATGAAYARAAYGLLPMNPAVSDAYGWALYERGETAAALQLLEKAATLAPAHAGIRWHLAQALAEAGRTAEARRSIGLALRDPAFQDRRPATALLKALGG
ncbi:tetratricopeptide repeat protein [Sphingomonas jeddahensis]|uniref:Tetratricopeptide repeat protein n=1 Tax=Sphingomonas jeddahensis TaxID=1915074 RepID=A0A1V2ETL5_9SPHN|nr:tetratricopeptide repeat protein [Sphingomonas jeddahensis]ONF95837.1 Tetratricopeptide repeat protein [Sphingomonas jeddahensis]